MLTEAQRAFYRSMVEKLIAKGLAVVATWLVARGVLVSSDTAEFVQIGIGTVMLGISLAYSWWQATGQSLVVNRLAQLRQHVEAIPTPNPDKVAAPSITLSRTINDAKVVAATPVTTITPPTLAA